MHFITNALVFALAALPFVTPTPIPKYVARHRSRSAKLSALNLVDGEVKPNSYIIKMKPCNATQAAAHKEWASGIISKSSVSNATGPTVYLTDAFWGYAAEVDDDSLAEIMQSDMVDWVEEDSLVHAFGTQNNAPWGLSRLSQVAPVQVASQDDVTALEFTYNFPDTAGEGVDVYVVDTGVLTTHNEFDNGRAEFVFAAGNLPQVDDQGHGSHCAGTIAGQTFGVAKKANIKAVKVLAGDGSGSTSDIIDGISFVIQAAAQSGRPSIISMSLGGPAQRTLDQAVTQAVSSGVHAVVAAGNESQDSNNVSPARVSTAITVGASTITDTVASFSNFGTPVDIFAPGQDIISVGIKSNDDTNVLSGTSMATPHVAGLVALLLGANPNQTPAEVALALTTDGLGGVLRGPRRISNTGTTNLLAQNESA
ncbi:subtilisin-like serine protease [Tulasnella sp. 419]|nr:subtilisin-like serine protease [Tulasnella sp. 418]KAG8966638.1 subtilisin-like serine protease [Tulasnella sp. 419]